jgi:eukaryotic-like serine/threonine-protein kinase
MVPVSDAPVSPGDILAGKYRVERILGAGNMGVVVAATNIALEQLVALKFMLPGKAPRPQQQERFLREARAAARLKSQHVAHVLDMGTLENGAPFAVMELLEGQDLSALLEERGPRPVDEAVEYILQTCEAMGEAHAAGIVHRDLKPANLFLTEDVSGSPCVKVLDFGISKLSGALTLTQDTQTLGSPLYMSPEQMNSAKHVDARSDIWALGVVLYQLLAGRTPFDAETMQELCARVFVGQPTPLCEYRENAPPELEAVILRCLEKDPDRRWPSVAEFAAALAPYAPIRARVYVERVARVLGGKAPRGPSLPDVMPPKTSDQAPLAEKRPSVLGTTTEPVVYRAPLPATRAPSENAKTEPFFRPPPVMGLTPPSVGRDPSLPSENAPRQAASPVRLAKPSARWGLILAGALVTLAVPIAAFVGLRQREPDAAPPLGPAASVERSVQSSDRPLAADPPKGIAEMPSSSMRVAPPASGPPPAANSSALSVPPPPLGTSRPTDRPPGSGTVATPSKGRAQPPPSPGPIRRPSHYPME